MNINEGGGFMQRDRLQPNSKQPIDEVLIVN